MYIEPAVAKLLIFLTVILAFMAFGALCMVCEYKKENRELKRENDGLKVLSEELEERWRTSYRSGFEANMKRNTADPARH